MFWDKNFQPSQNIEALLEKENVQVEEFLEEDDIIQECKTQKKNILNYFSRPDVIKRMVELITTEPSNELPLYTRFRHAYMACEILTLGIPSLDEKILADAEAMKTLYSYLENEPPLNTLLSSFVIKTLSMLFTKKAEQDWFLYQQTCLQLLEYIKSQNTFLDLICKHFLTPIVPDLIMQMIRKIEGGQLKRNIYEWLAEDKLVERLITILGTPKEKEKHIHVAQFLCDLIIQGRNMRQNDNQDDFFEPVFDGSNPILKNIESETTIQNLLNVILEPNALGSAIVSGITVVLTLIKPVVIMDEPESDRMKFLQKREQKLHEEILNTVIQTIAPRLKNINELMHNPPNETGPFINDVMIPTFGNVRLHVSRLFTALLHTRNEEISKTICETDFLETLLKYFKEYCWNNFLHTEMEKCVQYIFFVPPKTANSFSNGSKNSSSFDNNSKPSNNGGAIATSSFYALFNNLDNNAADHDNETTTPNESKNDQDDNKAENTQNAEQMDQSENEPEPEPMVNGIDGNQVESASIKEETEEVKVEENEAQIEKPKEIKEETIVNNTENEVVAVTVTVAATEIDQNIDDKAENETNINDNGTKTLPNLNVDDKMNISGNADTPSCLQKHAIVDCKIVPKFLDCWQHNNESETKKPARRLGYMGHLIKIFKHITACISEYEHIGALIESNLTKTELELWQQIIQSETGDLAKILATQSCQLANYNAYDSSSEGFPNETPKDFLIGNGTWDFIMQSNMINTLGAFADSSNDNSLQFGRIADDDNEDEEDDNTNNSNDCLSLFTNKAQSYSNPWENPFGSIGQSGNTGASDNASGWPNDFENSSMDNFADFDAHFCRFTSALDTSLNAAMQDRSSGGDATSSKNGRVLDFDFASDSVFGNFDAKNCTSNTTTTEYDSNANVEKSLAPGAEMQRSKGVIGDHLQSANNTNTSTESTQAYAGRSTEIEDIIMGNDNIDDIINETTTTAISELSKHKKTPPQALQNVIDSDDDHDTIVNFLKDEEQDADEDDIEEDEGMWTRPFGSSQNNDDSYNNGPIQTFFNSQRQLNETNVESTNDTTTTTIATRTTAPSTINNNINNNNNNDTTATTTTTTKTNTTDTSDITTTAITDTPNTLTPLDSSTSTEQATTESEPITVKCFDNTATTTTTTNDAPSDQQEQPNQCDATTVAFTTKETEKETTI